MRRSEQSKSDVSGSFFSSPVLEDKQGAALCRAGGRPVRVLDPAAADGAAAARLAERRARRYRRVDERPLVEELRGRSAQVAGCLGPGVAPTVAGPREKIGPDLPPRI